MIVKDFKGIVNLGQFDGVNVYIKKAINQNFDNELIEVVTGICFVNLEGEIVYKKRVYNTYICTLDDKRVFNLMDIIDNLALFVDKSNMKKYWKDKIIDDILNNDYRGLLTLKLFVKDYYKEVERKIKEKENNIILEKVEKVKEEIKEVLKEINNYEVMKLIKPNESNNYTYEFYTKHTLKRFYSGCSANEELQVQYDILTHLNDYLYYLKNDYIPYYFMNFDKVVE